MSKQMQQIIMLGLAGAAIYYLFFRNSSAVALPGPIAVTGINPGLIPGAALPQAIPLAPGFLTA
jgi:hypothetical protein